MSDGRQHIIDLIFGRWRSQILYAGVRLGVIETLAEGLRSPDHVAQTLSLNPANAYRLLRAMASIGVLDEVRWGAQSGSEVIVRRIFCFNPSFRLT